MKTAARMLAFSALLVGVLSACTVAPPSTGQPQPYKTPTLSSLFESAPTSSFSLGVQPPVIILAETPDLTAQSPADATQVLPGGIADTGNPASDMTTTPVDRNSTMTPLSAAAETTRTVTIYADQI